MPSSRPTVVEVVHQNAVIAAGIRLLLGTSAEFAVMAKLGARCRTEALWVVSQRGLIARPAAPVPLALAV